MSGMGAKNKALMQALLLAVLALVPAGIFAALQQPSSLPEQALARDEVDLERLVLWNANLLWIDSRAAEDFADGHIPSALLLSEDNWHDHLPTVLDAWQPDMKVVVYCDDAECQRSRKVAERLREDAGLNEVYILKGGWRAWLEADDGVRRRFGSSMP